ncbi:PqqD family peptide modification chaperone [candidate division WOR-3 bacterium]|nr:PqqD family peptide modification chaperone [candidate division WOR-3 bacterium]
MKKYYCSDDSVSVRLLGDNSASLFHPDTGARRYLNSTGIFIWRMLDGSNSSKDIENALKDEFDTSEKEDVGKEISEFLESLVSGGFAHSKNASEKVPRREDFIHSGESPKSIDVSVTKKCNLKCKYCFYEREMKTRDDLYINEWSDFYSELKNLAVEEICLSGGEVFVREDIWELIDSVVENNMRYSILTNGTLVNEKSIEEFFKGKRAARLSYMQFSIDGSCEEIHDLSRGQGSFKRAVGGLKLAKEAGLNIAVRLTVNRHNLEDLEDAAKFLLEDLGVHSFSTNDAMPMGAGCWNKEDIALNPFMQVEAIKLLGHLEEKYDSRIVAQAGPLAKWHLYRKMEKMKKYGIKPEPGMDYLTACGCVFSKLAVHHDGTIVPCNMLPDIELGKINRDSVKDIWMNSPVLKKMKERRLVPMSAVQACMDCEWNMFCNGSCPALAGVSAENFILPSMQDCYRKLKEETGAEFFE